MKENHLSFDLILIYTVVHYVKKFDHKIDLTYETIILL
jgi:hypothetical protein